VADDEIVDVVDEQDNVLYQTDRKNAYTNFLRYRAVHIFLIDRETGKVILLVRGKTLSFIPLHYAAVGGAVIAGETFEQAAMREVLEEVGIEPVLSFLGKRPTQDKTNDRLYMDSVFVGLTNIAELKTDPRAVDHLEMFTLEEMRELVATNKRIHPLLPEQFAILEQNFTFLALNTAE
jgi:8-oxo-dGTP pyrophosphatase MutT (NUDIX family)